MRRALVLTLAMLFALTLVGVTGPPTAATTDLSTISQSGIPAAVDTDVVQAAPTGHTSTCLNDMGSGVVVAIDFDTNSLKNVALIKVASTDTAARAAPAITAAVRHYMDMVEDAYTTGDHYPFPGLTAQELPASVPYAGAG